MMYAVRWKVLDQLVECDEVVVIRAVNRDWRAVDQMCNRLASPKHRIIFDVIDSAVRLGENGLELDW